MNKSFLTRAITLVAVVTMMATVPPSLAKEHTTLPAGTHTQVTNALRSSPLMFIENAGQCPDNARFQVRGGSSRFDEGISTASAVTTTRVSVASDGTQGNGDSYGFSVSADGRYVAFESEASNLVPGDTNGCKDVFVHDRVTSQTTRVSIASDGVQGYSDSECPSVSADGRYVVFHSLDNTLVQGDTNLTYDIFVHDRVTGQTTRVSVASDGTQGDGGGSLEPSISADGRYVAFWSGASNLVPGDTNGKMDVFVHDRQTGQTTRISVASDGTQGNGDSYTPSISADGRYVAFESEASNLVPGDTNGRMDVFVHDRQTGQTNRISVTSDGGQGNDRAGLPSISADGRYVVFQSDASNLVPGDTNGRTDVFVHDQKSGQTTRISVASDGTQGNGGSYRPSISADGRYVTFHSEASNLVSGDTNERIDVFIHDRQTGQTIRVSIASDGTQGNGDSYTPSISTDGQYVMFSSSASNLVPGDTNGTYDVFVHDRGSGPGPTYSISGHVRDSSGNPIFGVVVSAGAAGSATTDGNGAYTITGLAAGTYTLTPSKSGYTFTPATRTVSVPPDATGKDFTGYDRPPIVFVHGWTGLPPLGSCDWPDPDAAFQSVDDFLRNAGYHVEYARLETSPCYTPPLDENVPRLGNAIALAKAATNQPKVILIAHSMGGLVSRAYIEGPDYDDDVAALFTFGSPHQGVPVDALVFLAGPGGASGLGAYCITQPAVCEFSTPGMIFFNRDHPVRVIGVYYHAISGNAPWSPRSALGKVMYWLIGGGDDGIVPTNSGTGLSGIPDPWPTDEVHSTGMGPRSYFIRDNGPSISYMQCLKPVLVDRNKHICGGVSALEITPEVTPAPTARTPFEYGTLLAGQSVTRAISLEGGPTLFVAQWQTGTLAVTLVDPNDQVIDPAYATSHPNVVTYDADETVATYYFTNTIAGAWQLVLQATSVPADGSAYVTFAAFESDLALTTETNRYWYGPGATATITASLSGSPAGATVTATILRADGVTDTVSLLPQGAGRYQGTYTVPDAPGYAEVRLVATGNTAEGSPFERGLNLAFQISPGSVALTGIYSDTPEPRLAGSSFYKALLVTAGINSAISGTVGLSADLVDADGNFVAHSLTIEEVTAGAGTLTLRFDADDIYASRRNGPYTLTNLLLTDRRGATLVVAEAESVYTTAAYDYRFFGNGEVYLPLVLKNH